MTPTYICTKEEGNKLQLFLVDWGFELRVLWLQSRHSTAWATPAVHCAVVILWRWRSLKLFAWAGLRLWSARITGATSSQPTLAFYRWGNWTPEKPLSQPSSPFASVVSNAECNIYSLFSLLKVRAVIHWNLTPICPHLFFFFFFFGAGVQI
jgi:hypothetical protein